MRRRAEFEDKLSRLRWRDACGAAKALLREEIGLGPRDFSFAGYEQSKDCWDRFMSKVREQDDLLLQWPDSDVAAVREWLQAVRSRSSRRRVLWFAPVEAGVTPVAEVPLEGILERGIDVFVLKGRDLMVATFELGDGLCLELNPVGMHDEFEAAAWGNFAQTEV